MFRKSLEKEFLALLEPHRHTLYRYALRTLYRPDQAADVVQDVAMIAWTEFHRFERGTNFRAWIFKIMVNTIFNYNKKVRRERTLDYGDQLPDAALTIEHEDAWQSILSDPESMIERMDQRIPSALESLNTDVRQCLLLRMLEGFTYREIADMLHLPLGTVMSHIHRGRMHMRRRLASMAIEMGIVREVRHDLP